MLFKAIENLSIRHKLTIGIFLATLTVAVSATAIILALDRQRLMSETIAQAKTEIRMLSQDFIKVILYGNVDISADIAAKLETLASTESVIVYDQADKTVFTYYKENAPRIETSAHMETSANYDGQYFHITEPILYSGKQYGIAYFRVSDTLLRENLRNYYVAAAILVPLIALVSFFIAYRLQRFFSDPVIRLSQEISSITDTHNYSQRIQSHTADEFGILYRNYNELLSEIEAHQQSLQESEQRLTGIIEIVGSAIISIDEAQRITMFNRQAEIIFGYSSEEIIGQDLEILLPERYRAHHRQHVLDFKQMERDSIPRFERADIYALRKNGEEFPITAAISKGDFGGQTVFTAAIDDVTELRIKESELQRHQVQLEELVAKRTNELQLSNKELESYSHSIAHDLRAPLRSITSFSQILMEDLGPRLGETDKDHLSRIINASTHLATLIDDILQLSKITRGRMNQRPVNLSALAEKILKRYQEQEPKRNAVWKISPGLNITGDPMLMELMLENLLGNAWKFSRKNQHSEIRFSKAKQNGKQTFVISDNGIGFDMRYAGKLFHEFQRLHGKDEFEGTGIGLATVKRIISRHGGEIWVESEKGKGTEFYFTL